MPTLLYNMTVAIDRPVEEEWTVWMREQQLPILQSTGIFSEIRFYRVVTHDDPGSASYCLQLSTDHAEKLNELLNGPVKDFLREMQARYPDRHAVFQTLLERM